MDTTKPSQGLPPYTPLLSTSSGYASAPSVNREHFADDMTGYQSGLPAGYVQEGYSYPAGAVPTPQVVIVGGCPACKAGVLDDQFTCMGILCAIFLFPIGILCCLATRQRRCSNCGAQFG